MRNATLHHQLEDYAIQACGQLSAWAAAGEEIPFELCEEPVGGTVPLYCYRPLTGRFVQERRGRLCALPAHAAAARVLAECDALDLYLAAHGEIRVPGDRLGAAELALVVFLRAMFAERTDLGFEPAHFETAYAELERTVYAETGAATVVAPLLGVALDVDTVELTLGEGVSLIRGDALADAPREAVWSAGSEPNVLVVLSVAEPVGAREAVSLARIRFRRALSALRLFEPGTFALGPLLWARPDGGRWRTVPSATAGRLGAGRQRTVVPAGQEEELRAFYRLAGRRGGSPGSGELAWALARFEMGCERPLAGEALSDHLLALRALLEPEGPASGRLAQRLAVICAQPDGRAALARRTARAVELEREVITGMTDPGSGGAPMQELVAELAAHLRAILRDALCGHLEADLCALADELIAEAADALQPTGAR